MSTLGKAYSSVPEMSVDMDAGVDQAVKADSLETQELAEDLNRFCSSVNERKFLPVLPGLS